MVDVNREMQLKVYKFVHPVCSD